eukprot:6701322-Pyramimonas_sp.AAC.1
MRFSGRIGPIAPTKNRAGSVHEMDTKHWNRSCRISYPLNKHNIEYNKSDNMLLLDCPYKPNDCGLDPSAHQKSSGDRFTPSRHSAAPPTASPTSYHQCPTQSKGATASTHSRLNALARVALRGGNSREAYRKRPHPSSAITLHPWPAIPNIL